MNDDEKDKLLAGNTALEEAAKHLSYQSIIDWAVTQLAAA